jgi:hypothetical protein
MVTYTTVARDLVRYKLDLVGTEEVVWDKGGALRVKDYKFYVVYFTMERKWK